LEAWLKIFVGLALLFVSVGYLYRPVWILRLNALARALVFNDTYLLHYRRRWGIPLFAAAAVFFFSGFNNLSQYRPHPAARLWMAYRSFTAHEYRQTIIQCEGILAEDPESQQAWSLLGSAWSALGNRDKAAKAWSRSLALGQTDPLGRPPLKKKP
jgi:cytochrome c-type biogenesis protein CcmH/NrfG